MKFNKINDQFALIWAKKIKAVRLLGGKCENCGNNDIFCLDFHHVEDKEFAISTIRNSRWTKIVNEIKKCKLLCRNCHRELHCCSSDDKKHNQKKELMERINKLRCEKCGHIGKNYASLEFHHLKKQDKNFKINDGLYNRHNVASSVQELMDEIKKCKVLCSNCHIKEHINIKKFSELEDIIMKKVKEHKELQRPLDRQTIYNMYDNGKSVCQISKELKCCGSTISMILTKYKNGTLR